MNKLDDLFDALQKNIDNNFKQLADKIDQVLDTDISKSGVVDKAAESAGKWEWWYKSEAGNEFFFYVVDRQVQDQHQLWQYVKGIEFRFEHQEWSVLTRTYTIPNFDSAGWKAIDKKEIDIKSAQCIDYIKDNCKIG